MPTPVASPPVSLHPWLKVMASLFIGWHFFTIGMQVLSARSGPWPTPFGGDTFFAPRFATAVSDLTSPGYLEPLRMTHNYHFATNQPAMPEVHIEALVKDAAGNVIATRRIPEDNVGSAVRYRQILLARGMTDDQPVQPQGGEIIPAPGARVKTTQIWEMQEGGKKLRLKAVPDHLVPRDRPVARPSDWSMVLANSYARHLRTEYGGASVELIRYYRDPVSPMVLFMNEPPPGVLDEMICYFGEMTR